MPRRALLAPALLALLAGCGTAPTSDSGNATAPANLAAPPPAIGNTAVLPDRPTMMARCRGRAAAGAPAGTDIEALCNCAVDRVIAGAERMEAASQCLAELGAPPAMVNGSGEPR